MTGQDRLKSLGGQRIQWHSYTLDTGMKYSRKENESRNAPADAAIIAEMMKSGSCRRKR
jgi:coproporphyrinogen III oxidase-like Fe-S oxidoreductase